MSTGSIKYRKDIDGLRAVAVCAVLSFHAFPNLVPGGFVGVDVFFVISGFLISGIIMEGLDRGTFTYKEFYARRARRIFPALVIALVITMALGWMVLLPDEFRELGKHVVAGGFFSSNIILWQQTGYFDTAAESKPLLHLWSLGVEEQFYLLWPLLLSLFWRLRRAEIGMALVGFASFILNIVLVTHDQSAAFYLPFTRFWELVIGAMLAIWSARNDFGTLHIGRRTITLTAGQRNACSFAGFGLLLSTPWVIDDSTAFPGWIALVPTAATALIILAGSNAWVNQKVLSNRAAVAIGLISYPLYLLHWPLLSFAHFVQLNNASQLVIFRIAILLTAGVAAYITYQFCEIPIRERLRLNKAAFAAALALALVCVVGVSVFRFGVSRINDRQSILAMRAKSDWQLPAKAGEAVVISGSGNDSVLFLGDSHMQQYFAAIQLAASRLPSAPTVVFATKAGCPFLPDLDRLKDGYDCPAHYREHLAMAEAPGVKKVVIAGFWQGYIKSDSTREPMLRFQGRPAANDDIHQAFTRLAADLTRLTALGKQVVIIGPHPTAQSFDPQLLANRSRIPFIHGSTGGPQFGPLPESQFDQRVGGIVSELNRVAAVSGASLIEPTQYLCEKGLCASQDGDIPRYKDRNHLRTFAVIAHLKYVPSLLATNRSTVSRDTRAQVIQSL